MPGHCRAPGQQDVRMMLVTVTVPAGAGTAPPASWWLDLRCKKKDPKLFILDKHIWLTTLGEQRSLHTLCQWWLSLKLYCESMHTFVLRWMGLPETLPLQDSCLPDPHRWTVHVWQIHTESSCNLKWRVLSAFSTGMRHHHRAKLEGCKVHRDEATTTPNPLSLKQIGLTHYTVTAQRNIHTPWLLGHILTFEYWPVFTLWTERC